MTDQFGRQTPTFQVTGDYHHTLGGDCAKLFANYGIQFIPAQRLELDLFLAKNADGEPAAISIGVSRPRQNGKTFASKYFTLWTAFVEGKNVLFSAHNGPRTREMFRECVHFIESNESFRRKLAANGIYRAQGYEKITLANGVEITFNTRTNSGSRGGTHDVIIIDEAQELTQEHQEAILPTIIAGDKAMPQVIMLGTPPGVKTPGTVFREMHDRAHAGELREAWWLEWAATEIGDPHDQERWRECNPMFGFRITSRAMMNAADTMSAQGFAREHLGWWDAAGVQKVDTLIKRDEWMQIITRNTRPDGVPSIGVKFTPEGDKVTVAICVKPEDEPKPYLEVLESRSTSRGTRWLTEWILENRAKIALVAVDGTRGERVIKQLEDERFPKTAVKRVRPGDMAAAASLFLEAVQTQGIQVFDQPDLTAAAVNCPRRRIGGSGFAWETSDTGDATLIEAVALAYWAATTTKRKPGRKLRMTL